MGLGLESGFGIGGEGHRDEGLCGSRALAEREHAAARQDAHRSHAAVDEQHLVRVRVGVGVMGRVMGIGLWA